MKPRLFVTIKEIPLADSPHESRMLVVAGLWEKKKAFKRKTTKTADGLLQQDIPCSVHTLTLGKAICHPHDKFDKDLGIHMALRRIKRGEGIGTLTTEDYTMLTRDHCQMIVDHKANFIASNIEKYISTEM